MKPNEVDREDEALLSPEMRLWMDLEREIQLPRMSRWFKDHIPLLIVTLLYGVSAWLAARADASVKSMFFSTLVIIFMAYGVAERRAQRRWSLLLNFMKAQRQELNASRRAATSFLPG